MELKLKKKIHMLNKLWKAIWEPKIDKPLKQKQNVCELAVAHDCLVSLSYTAQITRTRTPSSVSVF